MQPPNRFEQLYRLIEAREHFTGQIPLLRTAQARGGYERLIKSIERDIERLSRELEHKLLRDNTDWWKELNDE